MPHKKNPITPERICGMARVVRANSQVALENVALWHERDISHSSAERMILPDSTIALDYMLHKMAQLIDRLQIFPEQMKENIDKVCGLIFSQRVMLALVDKGISRETAYALVQRNAMEAWKTKEQFQSLISKDSDIREYLTEEEISDLFDYTYHTKHVEDIFERLGLV